MIGFEIILFALLFIGVYKYQRNWKPVYPLFYTNGELIKIGHRGAPALAHENTLASFTKAVETGMNGVELDVQYSADKQLVVFHDWDLKTLNGSDKIIEKMPYSEIEKTSLHDDDDNKIPLFREVLNVLSKKCIIVVEIKSVHFLNAGIEKNVLEIIKEFNFEENCIISSFNPLILWRIRKLNPNILTAYLWSKTDPQFILNSPLGVWLWIPDAFHADIAFLEEKLMLWIRRKKLSVLTFTVKTPSELSKAKHLGADGIIMDDPFLN